MAEKEISVLERGVKSFSKNVVLPSVIIVVVLAIGASGYFYYQYQQTQALLQNPTLSAQVENARLLQKVGALYDLPKDETPTIATVSDVKLLEKKPFFQRAQNGDKILIFTKNKIAILYRPSENKIIDFTALSVPTPTPTLTPSPTPGKAKKPS